MYGTYYNLQDASQILHIESSTLCHNQRIFIRMYTPLF
ncbi:hypothetical protein KA050_02570 [Candidatus Gracilibacteria bacterium]|nr:hypothetical protein [Candidatus Gracilibacteria bacterium]